MRAVVLLVLLAVGAEAQYYPIGPRGANRKYDGPDALLFKFEGVVKGAGKKQILLEVEKDQTLEFQIDKAMKILDGNAPAKEKSVGTGWMVVIDASRKPNGDLVAKTVRIVERGK
jgi:hypothetical protein